MAKHFLTLFLFLPLSIFGQEEEKRKTENKSRYSYGVIPALAFDSDLGFKYGAVVNLFDYGETKLPPHYVQYLFIKLTNTTKGTLNLQALLESETLINKAKVLAEASYLVDRKLDFFGFNGTNAVYNRKFTEPESSEFKNNFFYAHHRNFLRLRFDVQKYLAGSKLRLLTGFTFNSYNISLAREERKDKVDNPNSDGFQHPTLFENYNKWGIIQSEENSGGNISLFSLGLIYDSRNDPSYCNDGKWLEAVFNYSPAFLGDAGFSKLMLTYRQHTSFLKDKITFSFRVSSQQKLSGEIPFYFVPTFYDSRLTNDGVGGAFNLRGALRNRIAADGFVTGNFEIKLKTLDFQLLKQHFSTSIAGFYDNAYITQTNKVNFDNVPEAEKPVYFNTGKQKVQHTFGPGLYIVFNQNNVITINYGMAANKQIGSSGLYIGSSLLF
jgi:hypothetical protein